MTKYYALFAALIFCADLLLMHSPRAKAEEYLTLKSFSGPAGDISLSGGGFTPFERVDIYVESTDKPVVAYGVANKDGIFGPTQIPIAMDVPEGPVTIYAKGATNKKIVKNTYYVKPFLASVNVAGTKYTPFGVLTVSGKGFAPGETVEISLADAVLTVKANNSGAFANVKVTIPNVPSGPYVLTATGTQSKAKAGWDVFVGKFLASIYPSTYYILPGEKLTFSGGGFAPGETVSVVADSNQFATLTTDAKGELKNMGSVVVPFEMSGRSMEFILTGKTSGAEARVSVAISEYEGHIWPSNYYVTAGRKFTISGNGFAKGEKVIFKVTDAESGAVATSKGEIKSPEFVAPFVGDVIHVEAIGELSRATATLDIGLGKLMPQVAPSEYYILPGKDLTFYGWGFASNETVTISKEGTPVATVKMNNQGSFTISGFTLPLGMSNAAAYTFTGAKSGAVAVVDVGLSPFNPQIKPAMYYAVPGTTMSFWGNGYAQGETVETLVDGKSIGKAETNQHGAFKMDLPLPYGQTRMDLTFTGSKSGASGSVTVSLAPIDPGLLLSSYYSEPGKPLTVSGVGFGQKEKVTVMFGDTVLGNAVADAKGNVKLITTVPNLTPGDYTITATGSSSGEATTATFTIPAPIPTATK